MEVIDTNKKHMIIMTFFLLISGSIWQVGVHQQASTLIDNELTTVSAIADWAQSYDNVSSLAKAADIIVVGSVQDRTSYRLKVVEYDTPGSTMVFTDYTIIIDEVLIGDVEGKTILVHQTGGLVENTLYTIEDDPLLNLNSKVLLFLHRYDSGKYFILGGPQGHFIIRGEQVYSIGELNSCAKQTTENLHLNGITIFTLIEKIK